MGSKLKGRTRSMASRRKQAATLRKTLRLKRLKLAKSAPNTAVKGSRREWKQKMKEARLVVDKAIARLVKIAGTEP